MSSDLAIVMSGGGARAAYQVGFLRFLAKSYPNLSIDIVTGVSAGAVNAAFLACSPGNLEDRAQNLFKLWSQLRINDVFNVGTADLTKRVMYWGFRLLSGGSKAKLLTAQGLVETAPLRQLLTSTLKARDGVLTGIDKNLKEGNLKAVALTASSYTTGQSTTWVQGREIKLWERAQRKSINCPLKVEHIMASAALPFFFPAVQVLSLIHI